MTKEIDYQFTLKQLPEEDRPREKLIKYGAKNLSNAELLALIIRTGNRKRTAIELSQDILSYFGGLNSLTSLSVEEIKQIKGIGVAKSTQIKALIEISKRLAASSDQNRIIVKEPQDVSNVMMPRLRYNKQEVFSLILLNIKNQIIAISEITKGGLTSSIVHPREVFKEAIKRSSAAIILVHNHPSGIPEPSDEDIKITKRLIECGKIIGIEIMDHIVIGDGIYVSLKEKQLI
ncbi:MAG: RadC family protein [Halanaerobiales bacterium]